jgi:hypothetical protein
MTSHVYPDPQTAALTVQPGAANAQFTAISQLTGASVPTGSYNKMMFIRVAMFGGTAAPTLSIKAGAGVAVPVTTSPTQVLRGPNPLTDYVGDVQLFTVGEATDVFQIRMGFDQDTTETWQIGIQNNDAVNRDFTWVVADSIADSAQPWIVVTPAALQYASLINEAIDQSVQVSNKGTGPLNITSMNPALPAGFTVGVLTPLPLAVAPAKTQSLVLTFTAPATPPLPGGVITGTTNLSAQPADTTAGTSPGHNQQVALTATTQRLEVVLLLDDSGSMSWDPLGTPLAVGDPHSRWGELVSAVGGTTGNFLDLLAHFGQKRGQFGIARFPAGDPLNSATFDIEPMADIPDVAGMKKAHDDLAAIVPTDSTPMGDGLDHVLATATSYFGTDALSVNADRRWLILMSDGAHNAGTHNPLEFISPADGGTAAAGASLKDKNIELFAVAYGILGHSNVNHQLMQQLATGSLNGGQELNVDETDPVTGIPTTAMALASKLRDAIKSGLTPASSPLDPSDVFVIGPGEALHEAILTEYDTRVAFVLNWNTPDPERLRLELLTPNCELITPENAGQGDFSQVTFCGGDRSHMYLIDPGFLANADGEGGRPRYGTWKFRITSPGGIIQVAKPGDAAELDVENYVYDVVVDSTLRLQVGQDQATYFAGDPVTISARLTAGGLPVTGASVSVSTTAPAQSFANWLAALQVPADALARAQELLAGKDSTPLLVKQLGAQLAGLVFGGGQQQVTLPMSDPDATGTYQATFADTSVPEHYTFYVTATGITADGVSFHREAKQETFVLVRPEPELTQLDIRQIQPGLVGVTMIPRDRFGNVLLLEPNTAGGFGLVAPGATIGDLISNLDGTYTSTVTFDPAKPPSIGLQFGGGQVVPPAPIPVLGALHYVDRVVRFDQGQIRSANQHADPNAALGSVDGKPADTFVSLGAGGQLTIAIHGRVIKGSADDDITVFVAPDADLRSYRVEALAHHDDNNDHADNWVLLGTSIGVTRSFGLRTAHLRSTAAIRITDTSGRTRDANLTPLATPGVSIRGVGARTVGQEDDGN